MASNARIVNDFARGAKIGDLSPDETTYTKLHSAKRKSTMFSAFIPSYEST